MTKKDFKDELIEQKQKEVIEMFEKLFSESEREHKTEILEETLDHVEVCCDMDKQITEEQIRDFLLSRNVIELSRKARVIKFA